MKRFYRPGQLPGPGIIPHALIALVQLTAVACGGDAPTGPGDAARPDLYVLNSTGQTVAAFSVGSVLAPLGAPVDLGPGFDGDAVDVASGLAVATVSSFGGSLVVLVDLTDGTVRTATFPQPEGDQANPSSPSVDDAGTIWVGGRGSDAVYRLDPGSTIAERVAGNVGTFVERVVPVGNRLYAIDANIDDDGSTFQPLGPGRILVLSRDGFQESLIELPAGAFNPTDAIAMSGHLLVIAAGTFDPGTFEPLGNGALVRIRLSDGVVTSIRSLNGNAISLEAGDDGKAYVTTTTDFATTSVLRYDPVEDDLERGPGDPIDVKDAAGTSVDCWTATALSDGRVVCVTFSFAEAGRLVLSDSDGGFLDEATSGFGSTDLALP
jgi:hypothetical protein